MNEQGTSMAEARADVPPVSSHRAPGGHGQPCPAGGSLPGYIEDVRMSGPVTWVREHPGAVDWIIAAVLAGVSLPSLWMTGAPGAAQSRSADVWGVLLTLAIVLPLAWRRHRPGLVLVASGTALLAADAAGYHLELAWLAPILAVYSLACYRQRRIQLWPLVIWVAEVLAHYPLAGKGNTALGLAAALAATLVVWVRGDSIRSRRLENQALAERAERAEAGREASAARAVAEERSRMARELHDVVAHALGVMVMQAGGAGMVPRLEEAKAKAVLSAIEQTGRQALTEMRRLVGILRDGEEGEALAPQPGLEEIPALVDRLAGAGLDVRLDVEGDPRSLPPGAELSAYRIVQEALTNTLKHAGPATARVRLSWCPASLDIEVTDDGRGNRPGPGPATAANDHYGHGLAGMRERVALFGGDLEAGPSPGRGYRVAARLPLGTAK
jgi:signal transduction histidine kinase